MEIIISIGFGVLLAITALVYRAATATHERDGEKK